VAAVVVGEATVEGSSVAVAVVEVGAEDSGVVLAGRPEAWASPGALVEDGVKAWMEASVAASVAVAAFRVKATVNVETAVEHSAVRAAIQGNGPAPKMWRQ
jgi:hypothetical protein